MKMFRIDVFDRNGKLQYTDFKPFSSQSEAEKYARESMNWMAPGGRYNVTYFFC